MKMGDDMALTAKQRAYLKGLAHELEPVLRVGRARLSPEVIEEAKRTMTSHELVKVRIDIDEPATRKELGTELAGVLGADLVTHIGKITVLYKAFEDKPQIKLP